MTQPLSTNRFMKIIERDAIIVNPGDHLIFILDDSIADDDIFQVRDMLLSRLGDNDCFTVMVGVKNVIVKRGNDSGTVA